MFATGQIVHLFLTRFVKVWSSKRKEITELSTGRKTWYRNENDETWSSCANYTHIPSVLFTNGSFPSALLSDYAVRSQCGIWSCFIKLHFFVSLSDLFRCKNILKWIVSPMEETENFISQIQQIFSETLGIKVNNIIHIE